MPRLPSHARHLRRTRRAALPHPPPPLHERRRPGHPLRPPRSRRRRRRLAQTRLPLPHQGPCWPHAWLRRRTRAAQAFITRTLADGPRPASAIEREAALIGISKSALHRARTASGVRSTRVSTPGVPSGNGAWYWALPPGNALQQNETPAASGKSVNAW